MQAFPAGALNQKYNYPHIYIWSKIGLDWSKHTHTNHLWFQVVGDSMNKTKPNLPKQTNQSKPTKRNQPKISG